MTQPLRELIILLNFHGEGNRLAPSWTSPDFPPRFRVDIMVLQWTEGASAAPARV
jgi:hypothetical protein